MKQLLSLFALLISFGTIQAQADSVRMFLFGHSLLDHRPPINPTPSDETTVAHWLHLLSQDQGEFYGATGQYGFLPQHANLPPIAQWGYDIVPPVWDSDLEPFADADFTTVLITAANFAQWQGADQPIPGQGGMTTVSATETIMDWVTAQEPSATIYIYENWPDMASFISGPGFPPTSSEFLAYNNYTTGGFHDWWVDYQDFLLASRPQINVRMIPVGPILARLFRDQLLTNIPITELYEDDAPHGRPTVYFLAALTTYMAIKGQVADVNYDVPDIVHPDVEANYSAVVNFIWSELNNFTDGNGNSRVFAPLAPLGVELAAFEVEAVEGEGILRWSTQSEANNWGFEIEHSLDGLAYEAIGFVKGAGSAEEQQTYEFRHSLTKRGTHFYRLKQLDFDGQFTYSEAKVIDFSTGPWSAVLFPNPSSGREVSLRLEAAEQKWLQVRVYNSLGHLVRQAPLHVNRGQQLLRLDVGPLPSGLYRVQVGDGQWQEEWSLVLMPER